MGWFLLAGLAGTGWWGAVKLSVLLDTVLKSLSLQTPALWALRVYPRQTNTKMITQRETHTFIYYVFIPTDAAASLNLHNKEYIFPSKLRTHFLCSVFRRPAMLEAVCSSGQVRSVVQRSSLQELTHVCCWTWAPADSQPPPASGWSPLSSPFSAGDTSSINSTEIKQNNLLWYTIDIVLPCRKDVFTVKNNNRVFYVFMRSSKYFFPWSYLTFLIFSFHNLCKLISFAA